MPRAVDVALSAQIERLSARAFPAGEETRVAGWTVRRTPGVRPRRCNSLHPPADASAALEGLDAALAVGGEVGVGRVQVAPLELHRVLDDELAERGYTAEGATQVLTMVLNGAHRGIDGVRLAALDDTWVDAWREVGGPPDTAVAAKLVLSRLGDRGRFAVAYENGSPAGVGVAVTEDGWCGISSVRVAERHRRRGVATRLLDALLADASARGADASYLQVETENEPALTMYERLGYRLQHRYHYRVRPD